MARDTASLIVESCEQLYRDGCRKSSKPTMTDVQPNQEKGRIGLVEAQAVMSVSR